jgi:hypothetical protein
MTEALGVLLEDRTPCTAVQLPVVCCTRLRVDVTVGAERCCTLEQAHTPP